MNDLVDEFVDSGSVAQFPAVKPQDSFHVVDFDEAGGVSGLTPVADMSMRINGGYFALRQGIFDYLDEGDDPVMDGCVRAARDGRLRAVKYDGFWAPMDTLKERTTLEAMYGRGVSPWALWRDQSSGARPTRVVPDIAPACG
ncbi:hypothetical protein [Nocardioides sp. B-3]|uniref:hypothetical protein n=1 Tax=Nocardioides sp. B-3 TaxID=2895565 RepID=UPI0021522539|nr:hypothetical protein [Nocardioides sp. B-3]UUZ60430.1 hypothetical protein LP418_05915 [Nocardioides sp. B-3]